jgi:hypothetical protein
MMSYKSDRTKRSILHDVYIPQTVQRKLYRTIAHVRTHDRLALNTIFFFIFRYFVIISSRGRSLNEEAGTTFRVNQHHCRI